MKKKKILLAIGIMFSLMAGTARAVELADYTAYPPFLPRVVSPNILFLMDYSKSMIRPAYGECASLSGISDCRYNFLNLKYDYESTSNYSGYFDTSSGVGRYNCAGGGRCSKNSSGVWSGKFLNWLTMTQFDIMKSVTVGGDLDPAPEQGSPTKIWSKLASGYTFRKTADLPGSGNASSCSSADSPDCTTWPDVTYSWIATPASGVTTVYAAVDLWSATAAKAYWMPFSFALYGNTYPAGSSESIITILPRGRLQIRNSTTGKSLLLMPYSTDSGTLIGLDASVGSTIKAFSIGTAPNRKLVVTYDRMISELDTGRANPLTFQVVIYEGSNHVVYQYQTVWKDFSFGGGKQAWISTYNYSGTTEKRWSYKPSEYTISDGKAIFASPHISYTITPDAGLSNANRFQPAPPLASTSNDYSVYIDLNSVAMVSGDCPSGSYYNVDRNTCYDHKTTGLMHDFRDGEIGGTLAFRLAIMQLNDTDGGKVVKHFNQKDGVGWASLMSSTRQKAPTTDTPLAEALYEAEGYFKEDTGFRFTTNDWSNVGAGTCPTSGAAYDPYCFQSAGQLISCCKSFVLLVSSGNYSNDNTTNIFGDAANAETWSNTWAGGYRSTDDAGSEGTKANAGWLDNVAYKAHTTDWRSSIGGTQNLNIYAVNTFGAGRGDGTDVLKKAARYGGFEDVGDSVSPANNAYDANKYALVGGQCVQQDGGPYGEDDRNCDGKPDTYFEPSGGGDLKSQIISAVTNILKSSASGTTVSVLSTSAGGEGAIYQAYFYPSKVEGTTDERTWPGYMRGFFLDKFQNLRDDYSGGGTSDATLVMKDSDRIARMRLDYISSTVKIDLFNDTDGNGVADGAAGTTDMENVVSIWEAGKKLAMRDKSTRHIYTWLNTGGTVINTSADGFSSVGGTAKDFTTSEAANLKRYLRAGDPDEAGPLTDVDEATNIINFIRGNSVTGYRDRCITVSGGSAEAGCAGSQRVWALGDIVYSTPTLVGGPSERYDELYGDAGYRRFKNKYVNRRSMVYVGANDGMLHAFNAGVYQAGDDPSTTSTIESGRFLQNPGSNGWSSTITLGDELWAFVPTDVLPHLAWLACNGTTGDPTVCAGAQYTHVYQVDQRPKVTEVRIFDADEDHPDGWGTILILGMRFGGGALDVDVDGDGTISETEKFRSAYYVIDITNPEKPPRLLYRFYDAALGFTTSYPSIVRVGVSPNEKWFMVVGSGPSNNPPSGTRDYGSISTTGAGKVFVVELRDDGMTPIKKTFTMETSNTIMGDSTVVDENFDFVFDTIYIGSAISTTSGKIYRINTKGDTNPENWTRSVFFDPEPTLSDPDPDNGKDMGPLLVAPSVSKDTLGHLWVFFGTGRLRAQGDMNNSDQQRFYGVKDACGKATPCSTDITYSLTDLVDVSAVTVTSETGSPTQVSGSTIACGDKTSCSYETLIEVMRTKQGWYKKLIDPKPQPSERVLSRSVVIGGQVLFTTYRPTDDMCSMFGDSSLYAFYYETGTAYLRPSIGTTTIGDVKYVNSRMELGKGMPTAVGVAVGETVSGFVQKSTGEIVRVPYQPGFSMKSKTISWREKSGGGGTSEVETIYKHITK